jgi:NADH dehydrogenase/NADH:ubiquinone oxidoreductase subunit G
MIDVIQANFTPGKIQKILENQQPSPQFYNKAFGKYGAAIEEGLNTTTQKQMQFAQLLQLREIGVPIPDDQLLEACTLQNKKQLIESIEKTKQQQQQMAQQQAQVQMQEMQARIKLADAQTTANEGLGVERYSRVQENQALAIERRAAAHKDEDIALLNLVKALKEIDSIDIEQVGKLMQLSHLVKDRENQQQQAQQPIEQTNIPAQNSSVAGSR